MFNYLDSIVSKTQRPVAFYFMIPHGFFSSGLLVCILGRGGGGEIAGKRGMDAHFPKSTCRIYNHPFSYQKAIREEGEVLHPFFDEK